MLHFYRAMNLLHGHWRELEDLMHDRLAAITPEKLRGITLVDTTNVHLETDVSDEERLDRTRAEAARTDALVWESFDGTDGRSLGKEEAPLRMPGKNKERERQLAKLEVMWATVREAVAKADDGQPHGKALCALASKPGDARLVRKDSADAGRYMAEEEGFRQARLAAGTRLLRTSLAPRFGREVQDADQMLQQVEANHREFKSPRKLRPCLHRVGQRIEGHVMLNLLALNCTRTLKARTGMIVNRIRQAVAPLHATRVRQGQKTRWARTLPGEACIKASQALGWKAMPTQWQSRSEWYWVGNAKQGKGSGIWLPKTRWGVRSPWPRDVRCAHARTHDRRSDVIATAIACLARGEASWRVVFGSMRPACALSSAPMPLPMPSAQARHAPTWAPVARVPGAPPRWSAVLPRRRPVDR